MNERHPTLHLLPARGAPVVAVLRRQPSRRFHVIRWNTETDRLAHGSWFRGRLFPLRCDVSWNGEWMVYLAMGSRGETWNGVCRLPWLETIAEGANFGTWRGGGYFASQGLLRANAWEPVRSASAKGDLPFEVAAYRSPQGEDEGVLHLRLERDGWRRAGPLGPMRDVKGDGGFRMVCEDDPGWFWRPTANHPTLRAFYRGYATGKGRLFAFALDERPDLLSGADWATWDARGSLVVARRGFLERYSPADLESGTPTFTASLVDLAPPARGSGEALAPPEAMPPELAATAGALRLKLAKPAAAWTPPLAAIPETIDRPAFFASRDEWDAWLAVHHATSRGLWLRFATKNSGVVTLSHAEALAGAAAHGWLAGARDQLDDDYWIQRFAPPGGKSAARRSATPSEKGKKP